jgi:hypothetical protein
MRVWILSRQVTLGWDEIEGVFLHRDDALKHLHQLESDFPGEEYALESPVVIE